MSKIDEFNDLSIKLNAIVDEFFEGVGLSQPDLLVENVRYLLEQRTIHRNAANNFMETLRQAMKDTPYPELVDAIHKAHEQFERVKKEIIDMPYMSGKDKIDREQTAINIIESTIGDYQRAFERFVKYQTNDTSLSLTWANYFLEEQANHESYKIRSVVPESFAARATLMYGENFVTELKNMEEGGLVDTKKLFKEIKKMPENAAAYLNGLQEAKAIIKEQAVNYFNRTNNGLLYLDYLENLDTDNVMNDDWVKNNRLAATIPGNDNNKFNQKLETYFGSGWSGFENLITGMTEQLENKYKGKAVGDVWKDPLYEIMFHYNLDPEFRGEGGQNKVNILRPAIGMGSSYGTAKVKKAVVNDLIGVPSANQMADDWSDIYNFIDEEFQGINEFKVFLKDNNRIEGQYLEIADLYRNQGIGTAVIEKVTEFADKYQLPIFIEPSSDEGDITQFWSRFGFTNESELLEFPGKTSYVREPTSETNLNLPKTENILDKEDKVMQLLDSLKDEYGEFLDDTQSEAGDGSGLHFDLTSGNVVNGDEIYVEALYIKPDKQGVGVGREIAEKLIKLSNEIDVPITLLDKTLDTPYGNSFWKSVGFDIDDDTTTGIYKPGSNNRLIIDYPSNVRPDHLTLFHEPQDHWEIKVDNLNRETANSLDHNILKKSARINGARNWVQSNVIWANNAMGYYDDIMSFQLGNVDLDSAEGLNKVKQIFELNNEWLPGGLGWKTYRDKYDPFNRFWNVIQMNNRKLGGVDNFTPHWHYEIQALMIDLATHGYDDIFDDDFIDQEVLSEIVEKVKKYDEFANNGVWNQQKRYASNFIKGGSLVDNVVFAVKMQIPIPARVVFDYITTIGEAGLSLFDLVGDYEVFSNKDVEFLMNNLHANVGGVDTYKSVDFREHNIFNSPFNTTNQIIDIPFGIGGSSPYYTKGNTFTTYRNKLNKWSKKNKGYDNGYFGNLKDENVFDKIAKHAAFINSTSHRDNRNGVGAAGANEFAYDLDIKTNDMNYLLDTSDMYRYSLGRSDKLKHVINANSVVLPALNNMIYNELADAKELTFQNNAHHVVNVDNIIASAIEGLNIDRSLKVAIYKEARGLLSDIYESLAQDTSNDLINYGDFTILSHESPAEVLEQVQDLNVYNIRSLEADINNYYDTFANLSLEGNAKHVAFIDSKGHTRVVRPGHAFLIATNEITGETLSTQELADRLEDEINGEYYGKLTAFTTSTDNNSIFVDNLYVAAEERGKGIGKEIINRIKEFADFYGVEIELEPDRNTGPRLLTFYENLGFERKVFFDDEGAELTGKEFDNVYRYTPTESAGVSTIRPVVPDMTKKTAIISIGPGNQNFLDLGRTGFIKALAGEDPGTPATQAALEQAEELSKQQFNIKAVVDGEVLEFDALEGKPVFDQMREAGISNVIIDEQLTEPLSPVRSTGDYSYLDVNIANPVSIIEDQPRNVNDFDDIIVLDDSAKIFDSEIDEITMKPIEEAITASRDVGQVVYQDPRISKFIKPQLDNDVVNETAKALQDISRVALLDNLNSGDIADRFKAISGGAIGEIGGLLAAHAVGTDKAWKQSVMNLARSAAEPGPLGKQLEYIFEKGLYNAEWLAYRPFAAWWVSSGKSPKYFGQWLSKQNQLGESVVKLAQSTKAKGSQGIKATMDILKKTGAGSVATRLGAGGLATLMIGGGQYAEKALYGKWLMDLTAYTQRKNSERQIQNMQGMSLTDRKEFLQSDPTTFALVTGISAGLTGQPTSMDTIRSLNAGINNNLSDQYKLDLTKDYGINWNAVGGKEQVIKDVVESQDQWLKLKADTTRMIKNMFSIDKSKYVNSGTKYTDSNINKHANFFGSFNRGIHNG